jgi:predicted Zn finger-like uncharacterized protein
MTVSCPRCGTRYRLPPRSKLGSNPTYRCVQCRHVFSAEAAAEGPALLDELERDDARDDLPVEEPAAEFEDETEALPDDAEWTNEAPAPAAKRVARPPARTSRAARDPEPDEEPDEVADETFSFETEEHERPEPARERRKRRRKAESEERETVQVVGSPARFAVHVLLGVTLVYGVVSIYLYTHPDAISAFLGRLPMIGSALAEKRLNPGNVQLTNVRGEYQRVKGDKLVFVISGTAINNSPLPVKGVQIEGRLIGKDEQRQVVFCGAAPRDVHDLSVREIGLLQSLEPPREWNLGAGEQANFLVAFVAPPPDLKEFSAEVVGVQARPRAAAG